MFVNLSLVNPAGDRSNPPAKQRDVYMHVVKERDDGIVVRGARMVSTGAAFSHVTYMSQYIQPAGLAEHEEDLAIGFFVPFNVPGLTFMGRYSYEYLAKKIGSPFDYPLSSRFDESDLSILLDDVFIPWEDVTVYRNPAVVNGLFPRALPSGLPSTLLHGLQSSSILSAAYSSRRQRCSRRSASARYKR
jgi:4-hydroxyphenylacetate 3-monooxygenase